MNGTYEYLISAGYCKDWTHVMALRELIANAHDTATALKKGISEEVDLWWSNGVGTVWNRTLELKKANLLFGDSDKPADQVGQFGEGMKVAALVIVRDGGTFRILSGDKEYQFAMRHSADFDCPLLTVTLVVADQPQPGTAVMFSCTREEFEEAKGLFAVYAEPDEYTTEILKAAGDVYVLGVRVNRIDNAAFGYSLSNKTLMNRDRTVVDRQALRDAIQKAWGKCRDKAAIHHLLETLAKDRTQYEGTITCYATALDWGDVAREMYGEKVCLRSSDDQANQRAKYMGYAVCDIGDGMNQTLRYSGIGLKMADQVAPLKHKEVKKRDLTSEQQRCLRSAKMRVRYFLGLKANDEWSEMLRRVKIAELPNEEAKINPDDGQIWVDTKTLVDGNENAVATNLVHELAHRRNNAPDCSARFEGNLGDLIHMAIEHKFPKRVAAVLDEIELLPEDTEGNAADRAMMAG